MAADINELLAQLDTVEGLDPTLKTNLTETVKTINRERGEFGSKLKLKDGEITNLKAQSMGYAKAHDALQKSGVSAEEIPTLLEKLGVQKTLEEENLLLREAVKAKSTETENTKKELNRAKAEKAVGKLLDKHLSEFTDEQGKKATVHPDFIDVDKLLDGVVNVTDETVLAEKINQALKAGYQKQEKMKATLGFPGAKVPGNAQGTPNPDVKGNSDIQTIMREQGPAAAVAAARRLKEQQG